MSQSVEVVIVAFEQEALCQRFRELLESNGVAQCHVCRSGDQVRRKLSKGRCNCVVCGTRLSDGPAEWLCDDLPINCSMLLVGPKHQLDLCSVPDVFKLATPIRKEEALLSVRMLLQFGHRLEQITRPRRSQSERETVEEAKHFLMEQRGISEEDAHRSIQKMSMDNGLKMIETAQQILLEKSRLGV